MSRYSCVQLAEDVSTPEVSFTSGEFIAAARVLAAENPGNVYTKITADKVSARGDSSLITCFYTHGGCQDGSRGCFFGQLFVRMGVPRKWLELFDWFDVVDELPTSNRVTEVLSILGVAVTSEEGQWLLEVQRCQDGTGQNGVQQSVYRGLPWAACIEVADEKFPLPENTETT